MYPLTKNQPKPLLKVGDKPIIEHIIHKIEVLNQINNIHIVTNNKFFNNFLEWNKNYESKKNILIYNDKTSSNNDRLGALGDLNYVIQEAEIDNDVLVVGGDNIFECCLKKMYDLFAKNNAPVVAARDLKDVKEIANKFGAIELGLENKIINFEEKPAKPKSTLASTAIYMYTKEEVELIKRTAKKNKLHDNTGEFILDLIKNKEVYCYVFNEKWYDIGSHEHLKEANKIFSKK